MRVSHWFNWVFVLYIGIQNLVFHSWRLLRQVIMLLGRIISLFRRCWIRYLISIGRFWVRLLRWRCYFLKGWISIDLFDMGYDIWVERKRKKFVRRSHWGMTESGRKSSLMRAVNDFWRVPGNFEMNCLMVELRYSLGLMMFPRKSTILSMLRYHLRIINDFFIRLFRVCFRISLYGHRNAILSRSWRMTESYGTNFRKCEQRSLKREWRRRLDYEKSLTWFVRREVFWWAIMSFKISSLSGASSLEVYLTRYLHSLRKSQGYFRRISLGNSCSQ